jgi:hypothetical protein
LTDPEDMSPSADRAELQIVPRPGPFAPDEEAQVVVLINRGTPRNEIARQTGRDPSTVSRLAKRHGLNFDRSITTAPARAAAASDLSLRRLAIAVKMADQLERIVDDMGRPLTIARVNSRTGKLEVTKLPRPDAAAQRDMALAAGILFDKVSHTLTVNAPQEGRAAVIALVEILRKTNDDATAARNQVIDQ